MIVLGLTGSIGMGKSTISRQFAALGAKTASADGFVHYLMEQDEIIAEIEREFPEAIFKAIFMPSCHPALGAGAGAVSSNRVFFSRPRTKCGVTGKRIDRKTLGKIVFSDDNKRKILEKILHPRVRELEEDFVKKQQRLGARLVVLDIPLLFETGAEARVDGVVVVTAPVFIQRRRVLARAGMSDEKLEKILKTQMPDHEKCKRADFIIPTGLGLAYSFRKARETILLFHQGVI